MQDIDFLPIEFRQKNQRRQSEPWQLIAAATIVALTAAAAIGQRTQARRAAEELATISPAYEAAEKLQARLAETQKQLSQSEARAELYTYLRHRWPRTQLLAAMLGPLPEEVAFREVQILRRPDAAATRTESRTAAEKKSEEQRLESLPPAARDLEKLRNRAESTQTIVVLSGIAADGAALHRYLSDLDNADLFDKAALDSLSGSDGANPRTEVRFRAVLTVRPGYGLPGGPRPAQSSCVVPGEKNRLAPALVPGERPALARNESEGNYADPLFVHQAGETAATESEQ